ncbi:MAG: Fe-S cluster assembly sulfur transfer protein SufU [Bacteroidota bacterium]
MDDLLKELYEEIILAHNTSPHRFFDQKNSQHHLKAYNYFCGDRYDLYFNIDNGYVRDFSFHGNGCAISKAATSLLVQSLNDRPLTEALVLLKQYETYISDPTTTPPVEEVAAFAAVQHHPARKTCAQLSWQTLQTFLNDYQS